MQHQQDILTIHAYLGGKLTTEEKVRFEHRLEQDPALRALFEDETLIWESAGSFSPAVSPVQKAAAFEKLQEAIAMTGQTVPQATVKPVRRVPMRWLRAVAAVALVLLVAGLAWVMLRPQVEMHTLTAEAGNLEYSLPDGSVVTLAHGASLTYPESFFGKSRSVSMTGNVYFDVEPNPELPFTISTTHTEIRVLGTEFGVHANDTSGTTQVHVEEGKVRFSPMLSDKFLDLTAGQSAYFDAKNSELGRMKGYNINALAWKRGVLQYRETPMATVFKDIETQYHVTIDAADSGILRCRLNSTYSLEDMDCASILKTLKLSFHFNLHETSPGTWKITGGSCK